MNQPKKERFKTSVGGQALMEGIMMRGPKLICCAVRKPDGTIETKIDPVKNHGIWTKIPLVRGAISMIESLIVGYRYMMYSAQVSMGDDYDPEEEETAFEKWVGDHLGKKAEDALLACAAVLGGLLAILLFTVLPTLIVGGVNHFVTLGRWAKVVLEAVLKVAIFLTYMAAISRMKEIHRVFEYHGAEHKTIACYEAGDELTEGSINPHDILRIKGIRAVQDYMIQEVQRVYRLQGVEINDKHIEVIVRQMLKKIRIEESGDTEFLPGTNVDRLEFEDVNEVLEAEGKEPAIGEPIIMGITKASLATNSFLSAASFQETTKVLTEAAIKGKIDPLVGLKENVIIGKHIPAGTGMRKYRDIRLNSELSMDDDLFFEEGLDDDDDLDILDTDFSDDDLLEENELTTEE